MALVGCLLLLEVGRAHADDAKPDSGWGDLYTEPTATECPGALGHLGLFTEDCDYNNGNPESSVGVGGALSFQLLQLAAPAGSAPTFVQLGPRMFGRLGHFSLGLGGGPMVAVGNTQGGGGTFALSLGYALRFRWIAPYLTVWGGGGSADYTPPGGGARQEVRVGFVSAEVGVRLYLTPYFSIGLDAQHTVIANHGFGGIGMTLGMDGPMG